MFDTKGSFIPSSVHNVFSYPPSDYYQLNLKTSPEELIKVICGSLNHNGENIQPNFNNLRDEIHQDSSLRSVLHGPFIPFFLQQNTATDIGSILESELLPSLNSSFLRDHPDAHFKVVIQDKQYLSGRLLPVHHSGYQRFLSSLNHSSIIGFYFPYAFPEFSISSQREAYKSITTSLNTCLSGPLEIVSASITYPSFLINTDHYSPILCMSGVRHVDPRLEAVLKSYGPHLEFWILSNVLTPGIEQVSEQWYGGLTIYKVLE